MLFWLVHRGVVNGVTKSGSVAVVLVLVLVLVLAVAAIPMPSVRNWVEDEARNPEGTLSREQYQMMFQ